MKYILVGTLLVYGAARLVETFAKRKKIRGQIIAPYTLYLLVAAHIFVFIAAFYDATARELATEVTETTVLGILLVTIAAIGRCSAVRALGAYHSIQIEIRRNHPLITCGPYFFVRNPYYLSNAIEVAGFPLIVNSWSGTALALLLYWPSLYLRIVLEERALLVALKVPFTEYMRRVPRLVPISFRVGEGE